MRERPKPSHRGDAGLHDAATLAFGTLFSRILGFGRDLFFAYLLGPAADAFLVAFRVPNFFRRLLAEGSLGMHYGTAAAVMLARQGPEATARFARSVALRLFSLSLAASALGALFARPLVFCIAPGLDEQALAQSALCLRLMLPYIPLCLLSAVAFAHAAVLGNFRPQAWSPVIWNALILAAGAAAPALSFSIGAPTGSRQFLFAQYALCGGIVAGGLAQAALALRCFSFRDQTPPRSSPPEKERQASFCPAPYAGNGKGTPTERGADRASGRLSALPRQFLGRFPLAVLGAAPHQLHILAGTLLASFFAAGSISALYFAERLVELPLGLAGASIGVAVSPRLACLAAQNNHEGFAHCLAKSLRRSAFFSFPATAGLFALSLALAKALFGRGAFDANAVAVTAGALQGYCFAIPALCASRPLLAAVLALGKSSAPARCACLSIAPVIACGAMGAALYQADSGKAAFLLGLGLSAGAWANAALLLRHAWGKDMACPARAMLPALGQYALAAAALTAGLCLFRLFAGQPGTIASFLLIAGSLLFWMGFFLGIRNQDALAVLSLLKKRKD